MMQKYSHGNGSKPIPSSLLFFQVIILLVMIISMPSVYATSIKDRPEKDPEDHSSNVVVQQKIISGRVFDGETGSSMPGVNVLVKRKNIGVQTDADGRYTIRVPDQSNDILVFSFIGYVSIEVPVSGQDVIDVTLQADVTGLDEIVVIGYGTQQKANLTGSVSNVDFTNISTRPTSNAITSLAGAMPGLAIIQGGGQPGTNQNSILIRGMGSINAAMTPLIILDGITSSAAAFADLNPNDIQSITVLKDAASSAIYGSRAANGVILITTKEGLNNDLKINFNSYLGLQKATILPKMLNSWDAAMLENESRLNSGMAIFFSDEQIELMKNDDPSDHFHNTNWINEVFRTAPIQNYNLSIGTGSDVFRLYSSFNYNNQEGIIKNTNSERYNLTSKFDVKPHKLLKFGLLISAVKETVHSPNEDIGGTAGSITGAVYGTPRAAPKYYNNGNYFMFWSEVPGYQQMNNPALLVLDDKFMDVSNKRFTTTFTGLFSWKGLSYNSLFSFENSESRSTTYNPRRIIFDDDGLRVTDNLYSQLTEGFNNTSFYQVDNYLTYKDIFFADHSFSIVLGHSFLESKYETISAYGREMPSNSLIVLNASNADMQRAYGSKSEYALQSFFARLNYNYKERYLFEANVRHDGSSRFSKQNRYGTFPSFSLGWRVSEETFLKDNSTVTNLKLRASLGVLGNQEIGNYAYTSTYSVGTPYLVNGLLVSGAAVTSLANENIKWETTKTLNIGLDLMILNSLNITYDYFNKQTYDMLVTLPIPITLGALSAPYQNIGSVANNGWEFDIKYSGNPKKNSKLKYDINFNLSRIINEVINLNGQEFFPSDQIITEGESMYSWYGYKWTGIFQNQAEIDTSAVQTPIALPGDIKYKDISGVDGVPDGKIDSFDRTILGNSYPEIFYGFGGSLGFMNFDFSIALQGVSGVLVNTYSRVNHAAVSGGNPQSWSVEWLDRWTPEKPSTKYPRVDYTARQGNNIFSDYYLEDGSYLKLRNIELGYSLGNKILSKIGLEKMRAYIGGQNLLTFTKVKHFDPERLRSAVRTEFYPHAKTYQVGINVTF